MQDTAQWGLKVPQSLLRSTFTRRLPSPFPAGGALHVLVHRVDEGAQVLRAALELHGLLVDLGKQRLERAKKARFDAICRVEDTF